MQEMTGDKNRFEEVDQDYSSHPEETQRILRDADQIDAEQRATIQRLEENIVELKKSCGITRKRYNHIYDVGFAVDTDQEDPDKVNEIEILQALLQRISNLLMTIFTTGVNGSVHGEDIGYCSTIDREGHKVCVQRAKTTKK